MSNTDFGPEIVETVIREAMKSRCMIINCDRSTAIRDLQTTKSHVAVASAWSPYRVLIRRSVRCCAESEKAVDNLANTAARINRTWALGWSDHVHFIRCSAVLVGDRRKSEAGRCYIADLCVFPTPYIQLRARRFCWQYVARGIHVKRYY